MRGSGGPIREGIEAAGGLGAEFPTISLGEDLMKPSAMLYRNLLAIEIEEMIRANPLDGIVLARELRQERARRADGRDQRDVPVVLVTGGSRPVVSFRGQPVGTGTALWRLWDERRAGLLDDEGWRDLEKCLSCGPGACQHDGHGLDDGGAVRGARLHGAGRGLIPAGDPRSAQPPGGRASWRSGPVLDGRRPPQSLPKARSQRDRRAARGGGSTNAVIHLAAIAGRAGVPFELDDIARLGAEVPVLANVEPSGRCLMREFDAAGGVPTLLPSWATCLTCPRTPSAGRAIGEMIAGAGPAPGSAIRPASDPLRRRRVRRGARLARARRRGDQDVRRERPAAAPPRTCSGVPRLRRHDRQGRRSGPDGHRGQRAGAGGLGPVGAGMPEWGTIPIPARLVAAA